MLKSPKIVFVVVFMLFVSAVFSFAKENLPYEMGMDSPTVEELMKERSSAHPTAETLYSASLPSKIDLSSQFPPIRSQGQQGSCVAWSVAYNTKSYQEKLERGWAYSDSTLFSPAFVYNQINGGKDRGSSIYHAMKLIEDDGCATLSKSPYNARDYRTQPSSTARYEAKKYKAKSSHSMKYSDIKGIKTHLASGQPVNFGMGIDAKFYALDKDDYIYSYSQGANYGGHAMVLVGYDDSKYGGAFKVQNSWGTHWGKDGVCWIPYSMWETLQPHVYIMYDHRENEPIEPEPEPKDKKPGRVKNLRASKGTYSDRIKLTWSTVAGVTGYTVYKSYSQSGEMNYVGNSTANQYVDKNVTAGTVYYALVAYNAKGFGELSMIVSGYLKKITPVEVENKPKKPTDVSATKNVYFDKIKIRWSAPRKADSYEIYRKSSSGSWSKIGSTTGTEYLDKKVKANTEYVYGVKAINKAGKSKMSISVLGSTKPKPVANTKKPTPPQNVKASKGSYSDKIKITWSKVKNATAYVVFKFSYVSYQWVPLTKTTKTEYFDKDIQKNKWTAYVVKAANSKGNSAFSTAAYGLAKAKPAAVRPNPPQSITASKGKYSTKVKITWSSVQNATYYMLYRWGETDDGWKKIAKTKSISYYDKKIEENVFYVYAAVAGNSAGSSKAITYDTGYAKISFSSGTVGSIKKLIASEGMYGDGIKLKFTKLPKIKKYVIFRRSQKDPIWKEVGTTDTDTYVDKLNLLKGVVYEYRVAPEIVTGSKPSPIAKGWLAGKMYKTPPKAPVKSMTMKKKGMNLFTWSLTSDTEGYYIYKYDSKRKQYIKYDYTRKDAYRDDNVVMGKTYLYGVRSFNWAGESKDMLKIKIKR